MAIAAETLLPAFAAIQFNAFFVPHLRSPGFPVRYAAVDPISCFRRSMRFSIVVRKEMTVGTFNLMNPMGRRSWTDVKLCRRGPNRLILG